MMGYLRFALPLAALTLGGCVSTVVGGAYDVATAPVRVAGWTADRLTTSQAEADRNYGRKMRKQQAREAKEQRKADKQQRREAREQASAN